MSLYRHGLYESGLYKSGLYDHGLVPVDGGGSLFDDLQKLSQPMILATKGSDPEVTGRYPEQGHCLEFDGVDQYVDMGSAVSYTGDYSIDFHADVTGITTAGFFVSGGSGANGAELYYSTTSSSFIFYFEGVPLKTFSATNIEDGQWHTVSLVRFSGDVTLYLDGVSKGAISESSEHIYSQIGARVGALTLKGKLSLFTFSGEVSYPLNQTTGDTAIDASGNGNHGTLVNSPTWAIDNTMPMEADDWNNRGGNVSDGTHVDVGALIPASTDDPTVDAYGNAIPESFQGSVYPIKPVPGDSYAVKLNGVNEYCVTGITPTSSGSIEITFVKTASNDVFLFGARDSTSTRCFLSITPTGELGGGIGTQSSNTIYGSTTLVTGVVYTAKIEWDGINVSLYLNSNLEYSGAQSGVVGSTQDFYVGIFNDAGSPFSYGYFDGEIGCVKVNGVTLYTCAEGVGATIHDTSGNGNHGTIVNGTTGTQGAGTWAGRIDGRSNAHNMTKGFTLDGDLRIPALADGSGLDARDGLPLTNPVNPDLGIAKGAETTLNYSEVTELGDYCPATANLSEFDQVWDDDEKQDLLVDNVGQYDTFFRNDSTKEDVVFYDTLTGDDFDKADNYTQ